MSGELELQTPNIKSNMSIIGEANKGLDNGFSEFS